MTDVEPTVPKLPIAPRTNGTDPAYPKPHVNSEMYKEMYKRSLEDPTAFWDERAKDFISWYRPYQTVMSGSLKDGSVHWFPEGQLNACYNMVDRWAYKDPNRLALIYDADEPGEGRNVTYGELLKEVCRVSNVLHDLGVRKGDTVAIYMPVVPEAAIAMLACTRIGAIHSVVFAGFSAEALRDRINDANTRVVITADEGRRASKTTHIKKIVDVALEGCPDVTGVLVLKHTGGDVNMVQNRDVWWHEACQRVKPYRSPTVMSSEDPLFILYTSGSTGKPKGLVHTTAGFILGAALSVKYVFDAHEGDRFGCVADVGWITGHTYVVYGPLMNGIATTIFESTPLYPTPARYWETVARNKLTHFYTAPTSIRLLRRKGNEYTKNLDLSSLRIIASIGEPINPEAWNWYSEFIGHNQCAVLDTYFQTETGSLVLAPLAGATETKPGSSTLPFFGIELVILNPNTGERLPDDKAASGVLAIAKPWPSMARTILGDHDRFLSTYLRQYPGYYFTGDGAKRDEDGYYWVTGRVDDVLNVSGHRLSTAEIESALIMHPGVAETAVIGAADDLTGQAVVVFVTLKLEFQFHDENALIEEFRLQVRKVIGPFATPKRIIIVEDLPKTRSGKIMRRIVRKIYAGEADQLGDLSTLANPSIVEKIAAKFSYLGAA